MDCGSNAIRAAVAEVSPAGIRVLERLRRPVRLGGDVFAKGRIGTKTGARALAAFSEFGELFRSHQVDDHHAVATSAMRNAANRDQLLTAIRAECGVVLETISGEEEASLVRTAVLSRFARKNEPQVIADLGGGSLEIQILRGRRRARGAVLPVGTVRIGELGAFGSARARSIQTLVTSELDRQLGPRPRGISRVALCGGNAKALAKLFPGPRLHGHRSLDSDELAASLRWLRRMSVEERMRELQVRRDRAEVIATAALVFDAVASWLGAPTLLVPGVGVLDGLLHRASADLSS